MMNKFFISFVLAFLILSGVGFSQTTSFYSQLGIGEPDYSYSARRSGMGDLGVAIVDRDFISVLNPASWRYINLTRVEVGSKYNGLMVKDSKKSYFFSEMYFSGFTFGFPVQRDYGIAAVLGIIPYSRISYESILSGTSSSNDDYSVTYKGEGGLSKAFLGSSVTLPYDFGIGLSLDYYFGNLVYSAETEFTNSDNLSTFYETRMKASGIGGTFGLTSPDFSKLLTDSENISDFKFGFAVSFISSLNCDSGFTKKTQYILDTVYTGNTSLKVPFRIVAGFGMKFNKSYQVYLDYLYQNWSDYKSGTYGMDNLKPVNKISAGLEYRKNPSGMEFDDLMIWRTGISYETTPYYLYGEHIKQYTVSGGVSLPISRENTLDLSIQYLIRGKNSSGLIKENMFKVGAGLSFGELWFLRYEK